MKRAGIKDFRRYDLRHTWASGPVKQGRPLHGLKELGVWKDVKMIMRYAHLSPEHLA
ncbi:tyrosine-type recombinase/integrase [Methylobacter sp. Wu1]|uniref:tyrosine-type recombinase/integrase n=1 Tax=Methylobacter sp. Wu1 TaxID=3119359 RepID=UPI002F948187